MGKRLQKNQEIEQFILLTVQESPYGVSKKVAATFKMSRQAANEHIIRLVASNNLVAEGEKRQRAYYIPNSNTTQIFNFLLSKKLDEDVIWKEKIKPLMQSLPKNVVALWNYSVTEMINNAIDHSNGQEMKIIVSRNSENMSVGIIDDGEGIFNKIQHALNLSDPRQAIFELKKGKLTTDSSKHSGQGIFYTSRLCDQFIIYSKELIYSHHDDFKDDWLVDNKTPMGQSGTAVLMTISNYAERTTKEIFDQYASDDESYQFSKTVVPVRLADEEEALVSRSQAKRLLIRLDKFKTVMLDFEGVDAIGQGFADEIFRVFAHQHPDVNIYPLNANQDVSNMIKRALLTRDAGIDD